MFVVAVVVCEDIDVVSSGTGVVMSFTDVATSFIAHEEDTGEHKHGSI